MADRIILCPRTATNFFHGPIIPPQMVDDLLVIAQIPVEQIDAIATAVEAEVGFLGKAKLLQLLKGVVDNESHASSVVAALYNLLPRRLEQIVETLGEWRRADPKNEETLSDEAFADLKAKLPRLIRDYPVLSRSRKTRRLRSILGNAVQGIEIICDARPVYNAARDSIEGLIPLTTMKIEYESQDEETHEVEVMLTREDVNELANKVKKAQQKLDVLDCSIEEWIPNGLADSE